MHCTGGCIWRRSNQALTLTATRGGRKGEFDETTRNVTETLLPHLNRAHALQQRLQIQAATVSVLDALPTAILLLGPSGQVLYVNTAAEQILRSGDGLYVRDGTLLASDTKANAGLRHAIRTAASPGKTLDCPTAVLVPRPSLRRDYQVVVSPLLKAIPQFLAMPAQTIAVLTTDPHAQPLSGGLIRQLYGLTPKEAELTARLAAGLSLEEAAEHLAMTYETARTHLRRIFMKTDTQRQSELALLLGRLPQVIRQV